MFWSYRLHKLGTLKCFGRTDRQTDERTDGQTDGRPDGRRGPTTRPAFAKATQVKTNKPTPKKKRGIGSPVFCTFSFTLNPIT